MTTVNLHDAKTQLGNLVEAAGRGETVILARHGRPSHRRGAPGTSVVSGGLGLFRLGPSGGTRQLRHSPRRPAAAAGPGLLLNRLPLDTDSISNEGRGSSHVRAPLADLGMGRVTLTEVEFGLALKPPRRRGGPGAVAAAGARPGLLGAGRGVTASLRAALKVVGTPVGPHDLLKAGVALTCGLTRVTHNVRTQARVRGLQVEDWVERPPS